MSEAIWNVLTIALIVGIGAALAIVVILIFAAAVVALDNYNDK